MLHDDCNTLNKRSDVPDMFGRALFEHFGDSWPEHSSSTLTLRNHVLMRGLVWNSGATGLGLIVLRQPVSNSRNATRNEGSSARFVGAAIKTCACLPCTWGCALGAEAPTMLPWVAARESSGAGWYGPAHSLSQTRLPAALSRFG